MNRYIVFPVLSLLVLSCSLFDPRDPEDPSGAGVIWQTPTSPDIVIENMASALNGQSVLYLDCLDDDFVFYADTNDIDDYPSLEFSDWTKSVENLTVGGIYSAVPDSGLQASFTPVVSNPDPPAPEDSVIIYREYAFLIPEAQYEVAFGIAEIHMAESEDGIWSIRSWYDYRFSSSTTEKTWAVAKAVYR